MHNSSVRSQIALSSRLLRSFFLLLFFCVSSTQVLAARIELEPNDWKQLVIPANPAGATIGELFLDDFKSVFPGEADFGFGEGWTVFLFNPDTQGYEVQSLDAVPQTGRAFWIIQSSDAAVMLDVPDTLPPAGVNLTNNCVSEQGCFTLDLPDDSLPPASAAQGQRYAMVGSPYPFYTVLTDLRILTDSSGDPCIDGCNLSEAQDLSYSVDVLWVWNSSTGTYDNVKSDSTPGLDVMPAWQGYWLVVRKEAEDKIPQLRIPYDPQIATVTGRVTNASGDAVSNALVTADGVGLGGEVRSDIDGNFVLTLVADAEYTVTVSSDSHARQVKLVKAPSVGGNVELPITVVETDASYSFSAARGGEFTGSDGVSVSVAGGSFVMADGSEITGLIDLDITSVDTSNPAMLDAFPGEFAGVDDGGESVAIYSQGTSNYAFSVGGEPVQLNAAIDATAEIMIPIYNDTYQSGATIMQGDRIALWSLNEVTGIWAQEGEGVVAGSLDSPTGLVLSATVSHFTWWNCDVTMDAVPVIIGIDGVQAGTALISATAAGDLGWRPNTVDTVVAVGDYSPSLFVPGDREVCYSAVLSYDDGSTGSTDLYCATAPGEPIILSGGTGDSSLRMVINIQPVDGEYSVIGYAGSPLRRVAFSAASLETDVDYRIASGPLPAGIELKRVSATRAELSGIPEGGSGGSYPVTVIARNADAESYQISLTIEIPAINPPPAMPEALAAVVNGNFEQDSYNFANDNSGGPATSWSVSGPALPAGAVLDVDTGELILQGIFYTDPSYWDWQGVVTATNASGSSSSSVTLSVDCDWCGLPQ